MMCVWDSLKQRLIYCLRLMEMLRLQTLEFAQLTRTMSKRKVELDYQIDAGLRDASVDINGLRRNSFSLQKGSEADLYSPRDHGSNASASSTVKARSPQERPFIKSVSTAMGNIAGSARSEEATEISSGTIARGAPLQELREFSQNLKKIVQPISLRPK